jgi:hypothetical protein
MTELGRAILVLFENQLSLPCQVIGHRYQLRTKPAQNPYGLLTRREPEDPQLDPYPNPRKPLPIRWGTAYIIIPLGYRSEGKHGVEQRCSAPRCVSNHLVRHMHVKVAHVDHDRLVISHIRRLVPPVREPVHVRSPLDCSRSWRNAGARLGPCRSCACVEAPKARTVDSLRVFGGCEVWANRVEVLG